MSKYALVVQSEKLAKADAEPFIPDSLLFSGLYGIKIFGPYPNQRAASDALRTFPATEFNLSVCPLNSLSEDMDNPYGAIMCGNSPDWS